MGTDPLTVAVVFGTFPPERNGGADFVARFAPALAERWSRDHVKATTGLRPERESFAENVTVHRTVDDWTLKENGRKTLRRVNELLRSEGVDIVHVLFPDSVLQATYQLPAGIGLRRIPLVTTFWNLGLGRRSPLRIKLESLALLGRSALAAALALGVPTVLAGTPDRVEPLVAGRDVELAPPGDPAELAGTVA